MRVINIEYKLLQAAMVVAPKKDVRYYLNGVLFESEKIIATDGHRLIVIPFENDVIFDPFIVSGESIQQLHSQLSAKQRREGVVAVLVSDSDEVSLTCSAAFVTNAQVDGRYPEWRRVVPKDKSNHPEDLKPHSLFNWEYMADFTKIAKILEPAQKFPTIEMYPDGTNSALVKFKDHPDLIGVIMPIRNNAT